MELMNISMEERGPQRDRITVAEYYRMAEADGPWVSVFGGHHRCGQPQDALLEGVEHDDAGLLSRSIAGGTGKIREA